MDQRSQGRPRLPACLLPVQWAFHGMPQAAACRPHLGPVVLDLLVLCTCCRLLCCLGLLTLPQELGDVRLYGTTQQQATRFKPCTPTIPCNGALQATAATTQSGWLWDSTSRRRALFPGPTLVSACFARREASSILSSCCMRATTSSTSARSAANSASAWRWSSSRSCRQPPPALTVRPAL